MCKIATYVKSPILGNWLDNVFVTLLGIVNSRKYDNLEAILNLISSKDSTKDFPDVVLIDVENDLYSICIKKLIESSDCIKIIAVGFPKTIDETKILFNCGVKGYIDVTISDLNFLKAIMLVKNNHYYLAENHIDEILSSFYFTKTSFKIDNFSSSINNNDNSEKYFLSGKEKSVVEYLLKGLSYKEIAHLIGISDFAVNQRAKSIYKKCGVRSRSELSYLLLK